MRRDNNHQGRDPYLTNIAPTFLAFEPVVRPVLVAGISQQLGMYISYCRNFSAVQNSLTSIFFFSPLTGRSFVRPVLVAGISQQVHTYISYCRNFSAVQNSLTAMRPKYKTLCNS